MRYFFKVFISGLYWGIINGPKNYHIDYRRTSSNIPTSKRKLNFFEYVDFYEQRYGWWKSIVAYHSIAAIDIKLGRPSVSNLTTPNPYVIRDEYIKVFDL